MKILNVKAVAAAALTTIATLGAANAADMSMAPPAYKAPPPPATYNWTGCYIGGGGGFGWWREDSFVQLSTGQAITGAQTSAGSGLFGQGQGGCDYQFTAPIFNVPAVIGLFGDYEGGDIDGGRVSAAWLEVSANPVRGRSALAPERCSRHAFSLFLTAALPRPTLAESITPPASRVGGPPA